MEDRIDYHLSRARAELDLAQQAASAKAARSHYDLSSLHLQQLRGLGCEVEAEATLARA